jgi:hypothetical protein
MSSYNVSDNVRRLLCTDSAKAAKASGYGYLNGILYMAPAELAGVGNLCPHASPACRAACLGWHSGQADMVRHESDMNDARLSRINKARAFMRDRPAFMAALVRAISALVRKAQREGLKPCVRLNGSTDISWEGIRFDHDGRKVSVYELFHQVQFVDYTKNPNRFSRILPANLHLTFSRSEVNEQTALALLGRGVNVAVVFGGGLPSTWQGFPVIDGDKHDLRHLDPRGGFVVGLSPKGRKAKKDRGGFVVWDVAAEIESLPMAA